MINHFIVFSYMYILIIIRSILPLGWIILNFFKINPKYDLVLIFHGVYLIVQIFLFLLIIKWLKKMKILFENKKEKLTKSKKRYIILGFLIIYILLDRVNIPMFMSKGSDSLVELVEQSKIKIWILYGFLNIIKIYSLIRYIRYKEKISLINALIISILPWKKSLLIYLIMNFYLIKYVYEKEKIYINKKKAILMGGAGSLYILYLYGKTNIIENNGIEKYLVLFKMTYYSMTSYLHQIFIENGIIYAQEYSRLLGENKILIYFFNSFTKILFGTGIKKAIGPYLSYKLYGNNFPNGVNPTLFFELYYIYNSLLAILLLILLLIGLMFIIKLTMKKIEKNREKKIFLCSLYFSLFFDEIGIFFDSLNSIRSIVLILIILFCTKFINLINKKGVFK